MEMSTQDRIKIAATKVFTTKGLDGARMQDIADEAQINKAMLHYYFRSKDHLFKIIFEEKARNIFSSVSMLALESVPIEERIKTFVSNQIDLVSEFPTMPLFVMNEGRKNPKLIEDLFENVPTAQALKIVQEAINHEVEAGNIRQITVQELMLNLISLTVYPFIAEPALKHVFSLTNEDFKNMMTKRKITITNLIINDLKIK